MPDSTHTQTRAFRHAVTASALAVSLTLGGCGLFSPIPTPRGSLIEASDYKKLVPGTSTRSDVMDLLGSPTSHATFDDNKWIYISMTTALQPLQFPAVQKQDVTVLTFDTTGVLRKVDTLDKKNGYPVGMVSQTTPTPGTHTSVIQQLLGNVGRYNPMSGMGSTFGGSQGPLGGSMGTGQGGNGNTLP